MPEYIIKIQEASDDNEKMLYFRSFTADDYDAVRKAIDDHLAKKPRAKRSDAGRARNPEGAQ